MGSTKRDERMIQFAWWAAINESIQIWGKSQKAGDLEWNYSMEDHPMSDTDRDPNA